MHDNVNDQKVWAVVSPSEERPGPTWGDFDGNAWTVRLFTTAHDYSATFPFFTGSAITEPPTAEDVLASLFLDAWYADLDPWEAVDELGYTELRTVKDYITETHPLIVMQTDRLAQFLGIDVTHVEEADVKARALTTIPASWGGPAASEEHRRAFYGLDA